MKLAKTLVFSLLLLVTASLPVFAQEASGKFTVSHETRWGSAVLPAGNYFVSVHSGPVPYVVVTSEKNAGSIMAMAQYVTSGDCKTSGLELEQADGSWNVRSLCFQSQTAVYFGKPKSTNMVTAKAATPAGPVAGSN